MKKPSDPDEERDKLRQSIIGLGEKSVRKSYYPELRERIQQLEQSNIELQTQIQERIEAQETTKRLERQLQQSQKMEAIGTLAGGIAHDFNNILTIIMGYTELASMHAEADCNHGVCPAGEDLGKVLDAASRAKDLVSQILTFSRAQDYDKKPIQLSKVINDALKMLRSSLPQSIEIQTELKDKTGLILANETQIHQIIVNLGTNASHAMAESGGVFIIKLEAVTIDPLDIKAAKLQLGPGQYLLLRICDTGCGMNRTTLDRIFDPYFTTKIKGRGTGMGLAVVHGIVKSHGGQINVYSELDNGTSFQVYLPMITSSEKNGAITENDQIEKGTERLLLVDDEPVIAEMQQRLLETLGYKVTIRTDPTEALQLFSNDPTLFDLVITDMTMPNLNGAQFSQALIKLRPDIPIVLCTGFSELIDEPRAKAIGIKEFALKPMIRSSISTIIRSALNADNRQGDDE